MNRKYLYLAVLIVLFHLARELSAVRTLRHMPDSVVSELKAPMDPESKLARGEKLDFSRVGEYELSLVPEVSDKLGKELIAQRESIIAAQDGFAIIKGIGPKKAEHLGRYLSSTANR